MIFFTKKDNSTAIDITILLLYPKIKQLLELRMMMAKRRFSRLSPSRSESMAEILILRMMVRNYLLLQNISAKIPTVQVLLSMLAFK